MCPLIPALGGWWWEEGTLGLTDQPENLTSKSPIQVRDPISKNKIDSYWDWPLTTTYACIQSTHTRHTWALVLTINTHTHTCSVAKNGCEFLILLLLPSQSWDNRPVLPYLVYVMLGTKPWDPCMLGKHSTNRATPPTVETVSWKRGLS